MQCLLFACIRTAPTQDPCSLGFRQIGEEAKLQRPGHGDFIFVSCVKCQKNKKKRRKYKHFFFLLFNYFL